MIDEKFEKIMQSNKGCAIIIAGSDSDKKHIDKVAESLAEYGIPYTKRICSAHKQPEKLIEIITDFNKTKELITYIAIAGGTDALSGTLSFNIFGPVISCPPDAPNQSCLTNPPGSSNAYIQNPKNVGKFIAQMYAGINLNYRELLSRKNNEKIESLLNADIKFQREYKGE